MLNAKLLSLQARLRAWAVSEGAREGLLRPGNGGDPPSIGRQDVDPNPVHTKACRATQKVKRPRLSSKFLLRKSRADRDKFLKGRQDPLRPSPRTSGNQPRLLFSLCAPQPPNSPSPPYPPHHPPHAKSMARTRTSAARGRSLSAGSQRRQQGRRAAPRLRLPARRLCPDPPQSSSPSQPGLGSP